MADDPEVSVHHGAVGQTNFLREVELELHLVVVHAVQPGGQV